jgi:hypothetical protein
MADGVAAVVTVPTVTPGIGMQNGDGAAQEDGTAENVPSPFPGKIETVLFA